MRSTRITHLSAWGLVALAASAPAQEEQKPDPKPTDAGAALEEMRAAFQEEGLKVDTKAGTITIQGEIGRPDQPIEFLLIHPRGKGHEAIIEAKAKASVLNAAFLLLGYERGENARIVDKNPLPTPEEVEKGAPLFDLYPPKGMPVWMTAKWTNVDDEGKEVEVHVPVEDMLLDLATEKPVEGASWIYLGGNMAPMYRGEPPVFIADFEGNYFSVVYKSPPNHLITMKHERADDDQVWWVTDIVPPPGTKVELTVHRTKTPMHVAREKRLAEAGEATKDAATATEDGESGKK